MAGATAQDGQHAVSGHDDQPGPLSEATVITADPANRAAALKRLDAALDPAQFSTTLLIKTGRRPRLTIVARRTRATVNIQVDTWFWWSWAERIAPADDLLTAASRITARMLTLPPAQP
jgi:hypothetical protein